jgi:hypothetical protein
MKAQYGVDSMPETGENVAAGSHISRADQDGRLAEEIAPVSIPRRKGPPVSVRSGRASARRHDTRSASGLGDSVPQQRLRDGGQCIRRE